MSQMIQRKQTRIHLSKGRLILSVLLLALTLWPQPKIAQAQWAGTTDIYNTNAGNVGIGTTSPLAKLHVEAGDLLIRGTSNPRLRFGHDDNITYASVYRESSTGKLFIRNDQGQPIILDNGNVGIGTTLPSAKLHVRGPDNMNAIGGPPSIYVQGGSAVNDLTKIDFLNANGGTIGLIAGLVEAAQAYPDSKGALIFGVQNLNNTNEVMRLTSNGYVGIGTTAPANTLHLDTSAGPAIRLTRTGFPSAFKIDTDGSSGAIAMDTAHPLVFRTNSVERLRIDSNGNVGIGTTTPRGTLDVNGRNAYIGTIPVALGHASSGYPGIGYNFEAQADGDWKYKVTDTAYMIGLGQSHRMDFNYAPLGTGGNLITWNTAMSIKNDGNIGIGTTTPDSTSKLTVNGNVTVTGNIAAKYQDVAEWVPSSKAMLAGTVVVLDTAHMNQVLPSLKAYDTRVAGVVSGMPGIILGEAGDGKVKVATTGRVKVKVDATEKPIQVGDLLVTSDKEGIAMKSEPMEINGRPFHQPGTILGKALEPLPEGEGEILVLLSLQ
jgi:hypothetical protein